MTSKTWLRLGRRWQASPLRFRCSTGHKPWVPPVPGFMVKMLPKEFGDMFRWIREKGFKADIAQVRQEYPQLLTFAGWVKKYTDEH